MHNVPSVGASLVQGIVTALLDPISDLTSWVPVRTCRLATFRRKIDVSGIEVSWLPQNKTRRGERRARVGLD